MEAGRAAQRSARVVPALPAWGVGRRPLTQPANQPLLRCPGRLPPFPLLAPSIQFPSLSLVRKGNSRIDPLLLLLLLLLKGKGKNSNCLIGVGNI